MRNCSLRVGVVCAVLALANGALAGGKGRKEVSRVETRVESRPIPHEVRYEFSRLVGPGRLVKGQEGEDGEVRKIYRVFYSDGKVVGKEHVSTERIEPKHTIYYMGRHGFPTSRGSFKRSRVLTMEATAYDPSPATIGPGATGRTRTGMKAGFGHVAVDPRVIPLKSLVYVEGYGFAIASDTGSAIKGNRIDLCFASRRTALRFGRRKVRVHVFGR